MDLVEWRFYGFFLGILLVCIYIYFFFLHFAVLFAAGLPLSPTPLQDDMRLERRRCIQVILFSRMFRREIFDVLDVLLFLFHSLHPQNYVVPTSVEYLRICRISKSCFALWNSSATVQEEDGFPEWKYCFQSFMQKKSLLLKMLTKCTAFSLILFVITPF